MADFGRLVRQKQQVEQSILKARQRLADLESRLGEIERSLQQENARHVAAAEAKRQLWERKDERPKS